MFEVLNMLNIGNICLLYGTKASPIISPDYNKFYITFNIMKITSQFLVFNAANFIIYLFLLIIYKVTYF